MDYSGETNYEKLKMEALAEDIRKEKARYAELISSLESRINEMHNYWVEDAAAEAVYQKLASQFQTFKANMREGEDTMTMFENQVLQQVDRYTEAEQETMNAIDG